VMKLVGKMILEQFFAFGRVEVHENGRVGRDVEDKAVVPGLDDWIDLSRDAGGLRQVGERALGDFRNVCAFPSV
jgi:hypothetical protein